MPPLRARSSIAKTARARGRFEGRGRRRLTCPECGYASKTTEPFLDLSLEPLESVNQRPQSWSAPEDDSVKGGRSGRCGELRSAGASYRRPRRPQDYPEALVVHLKRFRCPAAPATTT